MVLLRFAVAAIALSTLSAPLHAACMNKFTNRTEGPRQVTTLLTGKMTFQEAQALAEQITQQKAPPFEWVGDDGKVISRQFGQLKVVRPMPVGCDGKASGVIVIATFVTPQKPVGKMNVKLDPKTTVAFEQQ
jgi:hypothetical protein